MCGAGGHSGGIYSVPSAQFLGQFKSSFKSLLKTNKYKYRELEVKYNLPKGTQLAKECLQASSLLPLLKPTSYQLVYLLGQLIKVYIWYFFNLKYLSRNNHSDAHLSIRSFMDTSIGYHETV